MLAEDYFNDIDEGVCIKKSFNSAAKGKGQKAKENIA